MKLILQHFQWEIFIILFSDTSHFDVVIYFLAHLKDELLV